MRRLVLLRHARTAAVRGAAFPVEGEPLDAAGEADARVAAPGVAAAGWARDGVACSPLARARRTAELLGLSGAVTDVALREADFGSWAGRSLEEVSATEPDVVAAWMGDADAAPHGGESLRVLLGRVGDWLDRQASHDGRLLAVTHGGVIKAAVVHALEAPIEAFWRVDIAPLHAVELHGWDARWTVAGMNVPVGT
ncbi:histidine phosphatase family protein [Paraconexibacter sp.]|uniref:histidine phosphatase family protein n=1 Tax=Paraconexibacter sp. TaxID=2949640 RepID=UPI003566F2F8